MPWNEKIGLAKLNPQQQDVEDYNCNRQHLNKGFDVVMPQDIRINKDVIQNCLNTQIVNV